MRRRLLLALALWVAGCRCAAEQGAAGGAETGADEAPELAKARSIVDALRRESAALMPDPIKPAALGMSMAELGRARPAARPNPPHEGDPRVWMQEDLAAAARALYGFGRRSHLLEQVQVLSLVPTRDAISPHLDAMHEAYGSPTGVYDCPATEELPPTRRFTWRRAYAAVQDIVLVYRDRVSLTFYIAPGEEIAESLRRARCRRATDVTTFPIATQMPTSPAEAPAARPRVLTKRR